MQQVASLDAPARKVADHSVGRSLIVVVFIALLSFISLYRAEPPAARATADANEFAAGRAMETVRAIGQKPHPLGSTEHSVVRDYLLGRLQNLGVAAAIQNAVGVRQSRSGRLAAANVDNIVGRIPGSNSSGAVVLSAHYDSVPAGPGGSDDGSGVATLLETVRALKSGAALKNDVIILLTDGEEAGLLGAKAFVDENPLAKEARVDLNFEARGNRGPAMMFETTPGNEWLITELASAAPRPVTNSLLQEAYKALPNDTDLTVFREAGIAGLNFAYFYGVGDYHTANDTVGNLDENSLQHCGSYALGLVRQFGGIDLSSRKSSNAVYFDVLGLAVVRYPASIAAPLALFAVLVFVVMTVVAFRKKGMTVKGLLFGVLATFVTIIASIIVWAIGWWLIRATNHQYSWLRGDLYSSGYYLMTFTGLTLAAFAVLYGWFSKKTATFNLWFGAMLWWLLLTVLTSLAVPGASYLFLWPLLFTLAGLALSWMLKADAESSTRFVWSVCAGSIAGIVILVPMIVMLFYGLSIKAVPLEVLLLVLWFGMLVPHIAVLSGGKKWLLPAVGLLVALCFAVAGSVANGSSASKPIQNDLFYVENADSGKAVWGSGDASVDPWTKQFFSTDVQRRTLEDYLPGTRGQFLTASAPVTSAPAPELTLLENKGAGSANRILRLRAVSKRGAPVLSIFVPDRKVQGVSINGKHVAYVPPAEVKGQTTPFQLDYYALPPEGIELTIEVDGSQPLEVRVVDRSYGLSSDTLGSLSARPPSIVPAPYQLSDCSLMSRTFKF